MKLININVKSMNILYIVPITNCNSCFFLKSYSKKKYAIVDN